MTESESNVENNVEDVTSTQPPVEPSEPSAEVEPAQAQEAEEVVESEVVEAEGQADENTEVPEAFDALELDPEESEEISPAAAKAEVLSREVEELRSKLDEMGGQYARISADFENFRKRTRKEQAEQADKVKCSTILELLPVIDNFERARLQLKPEGEDAVGIHKSYQGIYKQLVDCLKRVGVSPMRAEGTEFNPVLHEAVMREPTDEHPDGTVLEELQRGYMLGERVLRHAMVRVAVALDPAADNENGEEA